MCTNSSGVDDIPELPSSDCVCVVFRDGSAADGLSDDGYATSAEGCRAYRERYPGEVDCVVDRDWHTLP